MDTIYRYQSEVEKRLFNLRLLHPGNKLLQEKQYLADLEEHLYTIMERRMENYRHILEVAAARLNGLSPLKRLSGGYVWALDEEGKPLESVKQTEQGRKISLQLRDGKLKATIDAKEEK